MGRGDRSSGADALQPHSGELEEALALLEEMRTYAQHRKRCAWVIASMTVSPVAGETSMEHKRRLFAAAACTCGFDDLLHRWERVGGRSCGNGPGTLDET